MRTPRAMICATPAVLGEPKGFLEGVAATSHPAFIDEIGGSLEETQPLHGGPSRLGREHHHEPGARHRPGMVALLRRGDLRWAKALEVAGPMVTQPSSLPRSGPSSGASRRRSSRASTGRCGARPKASLASRRPLARRRPRARGTSPRFVSRCGVIVIIRRPRRHLQDVLVV